MIKGEREQALSFGLGLLDSLDHEVVAAEAPEPNEEQQQHGGGPTGGRAAGETADVAQPRFPRPVRQQAGAHVGPDEDEA